MKLPSFLPRTTFARLLALSLAFAGNSQRSSAAVFTWDGGGANGSWSTAANWNPDGAPGATGNTLIFSGTNNLSAVNDSLTALATSGTAIAFASGAGSFNLSGNALTVGSGGGGGQQIVEQDSANNQTISLNLTFSGGSGDRSIVFASGAGSLTLSGNINFSNDWLFPTTTAGTIILSGTNTGDGKAYNAGGITAGTNTMNAMMRNNVAATQLVLGSDTALGNVGSGTASAGTASFRGLVANQQLNISTTNGNRSLPGSSLAINANNITFNGTNNLTIGNIITVGGNRDFVVSSTGAVTVSSGVFLSNDQTGRQLYVNLSGAGGMVVNGAVVDTFSSSGLTTTPGTSVLRKAGNGTLTLNGNSSYTALTQVDAGTLLVNGTHAQASTGTSGGRYIVAGGSTLGGAGTIKPYDTTGSLTGLSLAGITAPGDPSVNGGIGTLTFDGSNSTRSVVSFEGGGTLVIQLGAYGTGDKIALVNGQTNDIFFNSNVVNFTDTTSGNLAGGQYILFSADVANAYSGLTTSSGTITAGLTIGTGLSAYSGSTLQVVGNNIVLNLNAPAPGAPSSLAVTGTTGGTSLSWTAGTNAGNFTVKRATTSSGPYTSIATGVTATTYVDRAFTSGTTYYYVVVSVSGTGTSSNSNEVSAVPTSVSGTWTGGTGNYSDTTKWSGGVMAQGSGATMTISTVGTITDDIAVSLGTITASWNSSSSLTLQSSGGGAINFATGGSTPALNLTTYFSRYDYLTNLTITGTQGLNYSGGSNALVLQSGMNWSGFSGGLNLVGPGNGDGGMIYAQVANALPAVDVTMTPGSGGNAYSKSKLVLNSGANQTIGALNSSVVGSNTAYISSYTTSSILTGGSPSGTNTSGYSTLTIGSNNNSGNFQGKIGTGYTTGGAEDATANLLNITKTGSGTQTFSGTNNYIGTTTVSSGTLLIDGIYNQGTGANAGRIFVSPGATLGGTGTIQLSDTNGGTTGLSISGSLSPGDPATSSGTTGTLTFDGSTSARSVAAIETGGTLLFRLKGNAASKIALVNGQSNDIFFNNNVANFADITNGGLAQGQYVLVTSDVANAYSGLTIDGSGNITAGLSVGSGLSGYSSALLQVVSNNIVLNLGASILPGTPTVNTPSTSGTQVTISWSTSANATGYNVYRSTTPNGTYTSLATGIASTSYTDTTSANGVTYYYKVTATSSGYESPLSTAAVATPLDPSNISIIGVNLRAYNTYGMAVTDTAGVARVGYWNNIVGPALQGEAVSLTSMVNHLGTAVSSGVTVSFTAGKTASGSPTSNGMVKLGSDAVTVNPASNDANLYSSVFDQYDTTPGALSITGIPFTNYDVIFYIYNDLNNLNRGGSITATGSSAGSATYYLRAGTGNPDATGAGYVQSDATTLGSAVQGNYVRFSGFSGNFTASFVAQNMGDNTQRFKIAGFQIISRDAYSAPTQAPAVPTGLTASGGNRQVALNWTASATATSYKVYRGTSSGSYTLLTSGTVTAPMTSFADIAVSNGTPYYYAVSAVNSVGEGVKSSEASATPAAPAYTPASSGTVYQWSLPMAPVYQGSTSSKWTYDPQRRAYLWIPPGCSKVQGVMVGLHNMLEKPMFDDPDLRQACSDANLAILFITPGDGTVWAPNGIGNYTSLHPSTAINLDPNNYYSAEVVSGSTSYPTVTVSGTTYFTTDINPATGTRFATQSEQAGAELANLLTQFSTLSGYTELQYAPVLLTDHSAGSPFCWTSTVPTSAALNGRVFAIIPNKGVFPGNLTSTNSVTGASLQGIPILHVTSEYQEISSWGNTWELGDAPAMRSLRGGSATCLIGECIQPGTGHYEYSPEQVTPIADFIRAAASARIPSNWQPTGYPTLNTINPTTGWVIDVRYMGSGNCQAVSYSSWVTAQAATPNPDPSALRAYWYPDQTTAQHACDTANAGFSKKPQMINAFQDSAMTTLAPLGSLSNGIGYVPYGPTILGSGTAQSPYYFQVRAAAVNQSPVVRLYNAGPLGMGTGSIQYRANGSGSMKQIGVDTFRVWLDRESVIKGGQPWEPFILAYLPSDSNYRSAYRPIQILTSVAVNLDVSGSTQIITFPTLPNVSATNLQQITISGSGAATASSGLPVQYWVASGPYATSGTNGETLVPDVIPPSTKFPMPVVIGAWQWGRPSSVGSAVQSASPVFNTFWVFKDGFQKWQYETFGSTGMNSSYPLNTQDEIYWNALPANASYDANPASDGIPNLIKYATGMNPSVASNMPPASASLSADNAHMTLTFYRIADPALTYTVEATDDLATGTWSPVPNGTYTGPANVAGWVNVQDSQVLDSSHPKRFLRLRVTN